MTYAFVIPKQLNPVSVNGNYVIQPNIDIKLKHRIKEFKGHLTAFF